MKRFLIILCASCLALCSCGEDSRTVSGSGSRILVRFDVVEDGETSPVVSDLYVPERYAAELAALLHKCDPDFKISINDELVKP